jgi:hypothetical protein
VESVDKEELRRLCPGLIEVDVQPSGKTARSSHVCRQIPVASQTVNASPVLDASILVRAAVVKMSDCFLQASILAVKITEGSMFWITCLHQQ